jgi:hypothetical protein
MPAAACVSNQHSAKHCNRTILRVGATCIREDSTSMRAVSTRMSVVYIRIKCVAYQHESFQFTKTIRLKSNCLNISKISFRLDFRSFTLFKLIKFLIKSSP